jgi:hypothetical protein
MLSYADRLDAGKRRGAEILVIKKDGQQAKGELIAVKASSLLFLDSQTGIDDSVEIGDIAIVKVIKESRALAGGLVGFGAGAILGMLFGSWLDTMEEVRFSAGIYFAFAAVIGAMGAAPGALIGALLGADKTYSFEGQPPDEIRAILEKLRHQARIKDFQ